MPVTAARVDQQQEAERFKTLANFVVYSSLESPLSGIWRRRWQDRFFRSPSRLGGDGRIGSPCAPSFRLAICRKGHPHMLVLSRRPGEKIIFPAMETTVQLVSVKGSVVRIGIDAPDHIAVFREEVLQRDGLQPPAAGRTAANQFLHFLNNRLNASTIGVALLRRQLELGLSGEMAGTLDRIDETLRALQQRVAGVNPAIPPPQTTARRRALVVEDDRNECELLAGFLRLAGLDVHTAGDGADALDYLRERGKPDVVLLDMYLPRCDGPTTVRTIRRDPALADLTIFGLTGAEIEQFDLTEGPGGIDRWFRKPLDPQVLLRELEQKLPRGHNPS
jgi:carbon storage regulator CsrA